ITTPFAPPNSEPRPVEAPREDSVELAAVTQATPTKSPSSTDPKVERHRSRQKHRVRSALFPLQLSAQDKQRALIAAVVLGVLLLGGGGTWYLRRANRAAAAASPSGVSGSTSATAAADQPLAAEGIPSTAAGSATTIAPGKGNPNSDLAAYKELAQPT